MLTTITTIYQHIQLVIAISQVSLPKRNTITNRKYRHYQAEANVSPIK
jgi:hypothetical protein